MENYNSFDIEDWVGDVKFRKWVYSGEADATWQAFLKENPNQKDNIENARIILISIRGEINTVSESELESVKIAMERRLISATNMQKVWNPKRWLRLVAMIALVSGVATYFWLSLQVSKSQYELFALQTGRVEVVNSSLAWMMLSLPDSSSILLSKNSKLSYSPKQFIDRREVALTGDAFFEVRKKSQKPFYVHSGDLVTKVTGTSFSIKSDVDHQKIQLVVKSGQVGISLADLKGKRQGAELHLKANQLLTFDKKHNSLDKKDVENATLLGISIEKQNFTFKKTPIKDVFQILENAYGVQISYDQTKTSNCNITAILGDEPLDLKLKTICEVLEAKYHIHNNDIQVFAKGCSF